ncbi:hypothetical protein AXG93_2528s1560 [Marchantia polymorpha subsp. ruderalis]|uniref:Uncharacterized protein n=1 Tax=Marchantia polymorpha subsp. ruderalis TaxID=1480154 RepID=A0A176WNR4_MARPO|nr:hypothetical protein AXG93_2528s1560 [Marchantia polymorpha subsp. ruderalis]
MVRRANADVEENYVSSTVPAPSSRSTVEKPGGLSDGCPPASSGLTGAQGATWGQTWAPAESARPVHDVFPRGIRRGLKPGVRLWQLQTSGEHFSDRGTAHLRQKARETMNRNQSSGQTYPDREDIPKSNPPPEKGYERRPQTKAMSLTHTALSFVVGSTRVSSTGVDRTRPGQVRSGPVRSVVEGDGELRGAASTLDLRRREPAKKARVLYLACSRRTWTSSRQSRWSRRAKCGALSRPLLLCPYIPQVPRRMQVMPQVRLSAGWLRRDILVAAGRCAWWGRARESRHVHVQREGHDRQTERATDSDSEAQARRESQTRDSRRKKKLRSRHEEGKEREWQTGASGNE